jgi:hypothetical protein
MSGRRWTGCNDGPSTLDRLALVFVAGVFIVLWLVGYWWSEGF